MFLASPTWVSPEIVGAEFKVGLWVTFKAPLRTCVVTVARSLVAVTLALMNLSACAEEIVRLTDARLETSCGSPMLMQPLVETEALLVTAVLQDNH